MKGYTFLYTVLPVLFFACNQPGKPFSPLSTPLPYKPLQEALHDTTYDAKKLSRQYDHTDTTTVYWQHDTLLLSIQPETSGKTQVITFSGTTANHDALLSLFQSLEADKLQTGYKRIETRLGKIKEDVFRKGNTTAAFSVHYTGDTTRFPFFIKISSAY